MRSLGGMQLFARMRAVASTFVDSFDGRVVMTIRMTLDTTGLRCRIVSTCRACDQGLLHTVLPNSSRSVRLHAPLQMLFTVSNVCESFCLANAELLRILITEVHWAQLC